MSALAKPTNATTSSSMLPNDSQAQEATCLNFIVSIFFNNDFLCRFNGVCNYFTINYFASLEKKRTRGPSRSKSTCHLIGQENKKLHVNVREGDLNPYGANALRIHLRLEL